MTNPLNAAPGKTLSPAARRALREAKARREALLLEESALAADAKPQPQEIAGPKGAEPTRYGDWERGGIAYDF